MHGPSHYLRLMKDILYLFSAEIIRVILLQLQYKSLSRKNIATLKYAEILRKNTQMYAKLYFYEAK